MDPIDPGNNQDNTNNDHPQEPVQVEEEEIEIVGPDPLGRNLNIAEALQRANDRIMMREDANNFMNNGFIPIIRGNILRQNPQMEANFQLTQAQTDELERFFHNNTRFPDVISREVLARTTGLTEQQIQSWFIRRRIIRRQAARRAARADNLIDMHQMAQNPYRLHWEPQNVAYINNYYPPTPYFNNPFFHGGPSTHYYQQAPPPVPTPAPPPPPPPAPRPDRDTEDQISQLVDNLDSEIGQLKKQLKDEQDARKAVEQELELARREIEFLKNNSVSEVEELINMTAALELNKTGLAEQNTALQEQVAQLQNLQISLEAELAKVKLAPEGAEPQGAGPSEVAGPARPRNQNGEPEWMQEEW